MASKKKAAEPSAAPKKNLLSLIQGLEKDKGLRHVELRPRDADYLSTGCLTLNLIMGGGYFGGRILQIYGPPGAGKCLTSETFVYTDKGLRTIAEIFSEANRPVASVNRVINYNGCSLVNRHGKTETVNRLFMNGKKPVFRITTDSGAFVESTANHKHLVQSKTGAWVWRRTSDLRPGDFLIRQMAPMPFGVEEVPADEAYLLGVLVADAHFGEQRILVSNDDPDIVSIIKSTGPRLLGTEFRSYDRDDKGAAIHFNSKDGAKNFYSRFGCETGIAKTKRVPDLIRRGTENVVKEFLRGYMDTDSSCGGKTLEVTSASFDLLHVVKLLLQQFGIVSSLNHKTVKQYPDNQYFRLLIGGGDLVRFIDVIGARSTKVREKYAAALANEGLGSRYTEVVPHMGGLLEDLFYSNGDSSREDADIFGDTRGEQPRKACTYRRLSEVIKQAAEWNEVSDTTLSRLKEINSAQYHYDEVTSVVHVGEQPVFDIEMPESHSFVANGFVTHNSSISYMSAGELHKHGVMTLFFDHEGTTDAKYIKTLGMDISNKDPLLRYYRPNDGVETYEMMLKVMQGIDDVDGGLPQVCFFLDSIATMPTRGEMEDWESNKRMAQRAIMHSEWMGRLRTLVPKKNVSVIAVNQIRANPSPYAAPETRPGGNAWDFATDNLLKIKKGKPVEVEGEVYQPMKFKTEKNKNFISHQEAEVHLNLGRGIDPASDVIQFLKLTGCLEKVGKKLVITGLEGFDGLEFVGAAALERAIREERAEVLANPKLAEESVYRACEKMLMSGDAIKRYMAEKKTHKEAQEAEEDAATTKASSLAGDEAPAEEDEEAEAPKLGKKK